MENLALEMCERVAMENKSRGGVETTYAAGMDADVPVSEALWSVSG